MKVQMTWKELVDSYNDDDKTFERYLCDQLGICPDGCFNETEEGAITTEEAFGILDGIFGDKTFTVRPNHDYIPWRGKLNSDFRVSLNGGWSNPASAENKKKGGRPKKQ